MIWTETGLAVWRKGLETRGRDWERLAEQVKTSIAPFIQKKVDYLWDKTRE